MRILVAMSGGVDSSVAAALLSEAGHEVIGVHMLLHDYGIVGKANPKSCCGTEDALDARRVAEKMNFMYDVVDMKERFKNSVINNFISEYKNGRTPIPCTHCNGELKFDLLFEYADLLGCEKIATGHYARVIDGKLFASTNPEKDQSYFLWNTKNLNRVIFPVGNMTKDEVRAHAARLGLITANKTESMDLCFIPNQDTKSFLGKFINVTPGNIVNMDTNEVLGQHNGIHNFTVGQRKGLGVVTGYAIYVHSINSATNTVYVCGEERLKRNIIKFANPNFIDKLPANFFVRVRHRSPLISAFLNEDGDVVLENNVVVTPGQAIVFYSNENQVLGGAWIR